MYFTVLRRLGLVLWALLLTFAAALPATAAPTRDVTAQGNDCIACHKDGKALKPTHRITLKMKLADCDDCHERKTDDSLVGIVPGSHLHQWSAVTCADCHGNVAKPAPVEAEKCLSCHGSGEKVAARTAKMKPQNPHYSAHYNADLDCNLCHHQHQKSENYCAECHRWDFKVP